MLTRVCFALSLLAAAGPWVGPGAAAPPNVVLIISDDQGHADYSFLGHPHIRTPHLDRLAAQSLAFRRGHVPSSLCSPSLASILTGRYAHQHGITCNDPPAAPGGMKDPAFLAQRQEMIAYVDRMATLPKLLGQQGYLSFQAGKWWLGHHRRGGFTHGMTHGDPARAGRHGDEGLKTGRQGLKEVFDFIDLATGQNKPFFLWYAPMMPHTPHNPPERLLAKYRDKTPSLPVAKYWAMCEWFDETCGQLLGRLDEKGLADNTLVLYVCDNGWIQDPEASRYAPRSKQSPHEGGLRTPILVRWPGKVRPRRAEERATSLDLVPTALAAVGQKPPADLPGVNLLDDRAVQGRKALMGEIFTHNAVNIHQPAANLRYRWVVAGDWKLIAPAAANTPDGKDELYHVTRDPEEKENLAEKEPQRVEELKKVLDAWWPGR